MKQATWITVTCAFFAGWAFTGLGSSSAIPPAAAEIASVKWDYRCFAGEDADEIAKAANDLGREGWEMVTAAGAGGVKARRATWCFKRVIP